ncbi:MAG: pilin [Patescibacteria group bacterium]
MTSKFLKFFFVIALICLALFSFGSVILAAPVNTDYLFGGNATNLQTLSEQSGLGLQDPRATISKVINITLGFLGIIAVVLILIAGFLWMTAAGNEDKIATAKKLMIAGVIGLIIVLAAFGIAKFVINSLISATGAGNASSGGPVTQTLPPESQTFISAADNLASGSNGGQGGLPVSETEIITPSNVATEQIITEVEVSLVPN